MLKVDDEDVGSEADADDLDLRDMGQPAPQEQQEAAGTGDGAGKSTKSVRVSITGALPEGGLALGFAGAGLLHVEHATLYH